MLDTRTAKGRQTSVCLLRAGRDRSLSKTQGEHHDVKTSDSNRLDSAGHDLRTAKHRDSEYPAVVLGRRIASFAADFDDAPDRCGHWLVLAIRVSDIEEIDDSNSC